MKQLIFLFLYLTGPHLMGQSGAQAQRYVFFLHNMFVEAYGLEAKHPEYGRTEYKEIVQAFEKQSFTVISEIRPKNTDVQVYAAKVVGQIDSLLKKGVSPAHITVVGTSKGGSIAMQVSGLAKNRELNFVFIGCCSESAANRSELNFYGNILSIYERGDTGSCSPQRERSGNTVKHFKEIELHSGLKHGFLFKPLKEWIEPSVQWARQDF